MRVLIIPDVHLKPWIFEEAASVDLKSYDNIIVLGDLVDDWGLKAEPERYEETLADALTFAKTFPQSLWCYGNHDISYMYDYPDTGYSIYAREVARKGLTELENELGNRLKVIHKIDNVLFSHAGLSSDFLLNQCKHIGTSDLDFILEYINDMPNAYEACNKLCDNTSPIWLRPTEEMHLYPAGYLQVVGHTPVQEPGFATASKDLLLMDNFSTRPDGSLYGNQQLYILDTITHTLTPAEV